jgi:glucosamine-6-phosphate deaminase
MKINIVDSKNFEVESALAVSKEIKRLQKILNRNLNIVLATGNTMVGFLDELSKISGIDWKKINAFHLDEYKGLKTTSPYSFAYFLNKNLFSKIEILKNNIFYLCENKDKYLELLESKGGADIIMLGIGLDGHLAFNEPPKYSNFDSRLREVSLTQETIDSNICDYPEIKENPFAYTMGMADIMDGKKIFFLANKTKKAKIVGEALKGPITTNVPASILQKHNNVEVILDKEASAELGENKNE